MTHICGDVILYFKEIDICDRNGVLQELIFQNSKKTAQNSGNIITQL